MIGKLGGKQSLEDAVIYLLVIMGVGFGVSIAGAWFEQEATVQLIELDERATRDTESVLATSGYYEKSITAKVIMKDGGGWAKLIGIGIFLLGLVMLKTSPSKNSKNS